MQNHHCQSDYASCRMFLYPEWILCSSSPSVPRWGCLSWMNWICQRCIFSGIHKVKWLTSSIVWGRPLRSCPSLESIGNIDGFLKMSQAEWHQLIHMFEQCTLILELFGTSWRTNRRHDCVNGEIACHVPVIIDERARFSHSHAFLRSTISYTTGRQVFLSRLCDCHKNSFICFTWFFPLGI